MDFTREINGYTLEYFDTEHLYLVDGVVVPSITQILKTKFKNKYAGVDKTVLNKASIAGTNIHNAIEQYCKDGVISDYPEVKNFRFLQNHYKFEVLENEVPVILFERDKPASAGRLDMTIKIDGKLGIADIKRTSKLDKEYLAYQLNLYRIAYQQSYKKEVDILKGIHLREDVRKFVDIPINEDIVAQLLDEYRGER